MSYVALLLGLLFVIAVGYDIIQTALRLGQTIVGSGLPLRDHRDFLARVSQAGKVRRQLRWMVQDTGWSWQDDVQVTPSDPTVR